MTIRVGTARKRRGRVFRLEQLERRQLLTAMDWSNYAENAQHTAESTVAGQSLDVIHWETPVDSAPQFSGNDLLVHYGSPLVTAANTVIVPETDEATGGYDVKAFDGTTGALKWTQTQGEEFVPPPHDWTPSYSPAVAPLPGGPRLYFPGADGTLFYRDSPDASGAVTPGRIVFYGESNYAANPSGFSDVRISSPLTTDSQGNIFFTYQASGTNPLGLHGGIARIGADGTLSYVDGGTPALDCAPALSNDGTKLYAVVSGKLNEYNSISLAQLASVQLGTVPIESSASPTIGPNGDVYFGVLFPSAHDRGELEHFSGDLSTTYTPGSFGWDDTVSIVPTSMVPSYTGPSTYLLMSKDNDYAGAGGTGINKIALFDPKTTEIDPVTGTLAMSTVLSIAGVTPDSEFPNDPGAVREWCINNAVVDPQTDSIFANSEDGWLYRWDTVTNTFTQRVQLTNGVGEAYTPTVIGADGTVYAINDATLFAVGQTPSLAVSDASVVNTNSGTSNLVFTVGLSSSTTQPVTVVFATSNGTATAGTDYQAVSGTLTFAPATTAAGGVTTQTITVPILAHAQAEPNETFQLILTGPANATLARSQATGTIINQDATVSAVNLFYDNSKFNKNVEGVAGGTTDDKAIDPSKTAYLPGAGTAGFANVSAYTDGINGIMVDLTTGGAHGSLTASDFTIKVGTNNTPSLWAAAPAPSTVSVRTGSGVSGADRVELTWTDGSIAEEWIEVTVNANANTGLAAPYTFFYGSVIGNSGTGNTPALAITSSTDENAARSHAGIASVSNVFDYNKDGFVNSSDENAARGSGVTIKFIRIPDNAALAPNAAPAIAVDATVTAASTPSATHGQLSTGTGDPQIATGLTAWLNTFKSAEPRPLPWHVLPGDLKMSNRGDFNAAAVALIFENFAAANKSGCSPVRPWRRPTASPTRVNLLTRSLDALVDGLV